MQTGQKNSDTKKNIKRKQKIRLEDIAKKAGVSISSVSRYIRGMSNIDEDIQEKVDLAMEKMDIDKSYFTKQKESVATSRCIGLCIQNIMNPFDALLVQGIIDVANTQEHEIIMINTEGNKKGNSKEIRKLISSYGIKGIICVPTESTKLLIEDLIVDKIPMVLTENIYENPQTNYVTSDNRGGARNAVRYLLSLGHRKILYLAGDEHYYTEKEHYAGYCDALIEARIPIDINLKVKGYNDIKKAYDSMMEKMNAEVDFTAIFCTNDMMAFAAKRAIEEKGYKIPEDISIIGFDDIPFASCISLTTFSRPAYEMGRNAMFMLIDIINKRIETPKHVMFHPTIKIRNSCMKNTKDLEDSTRAIVSQRTIRIGYTPPTRSEFYDIIKHGANTMMKELNERFGIKFEFEMIAASEHEAVESQIGIIENWVDKKFDAILVSSLGEFETMNEVYQKAMHKGTAIYLFNMPVEMWDEKDLSVVSVIGYDNHYQAGYLVGQYAAEVLKGKGEILLVWGLPGHWATARKNGFLESIRPYPGLKIVGEQRGDYVLEKGMWAAEKFLSRNPNVNLIYAENDEMAEGVDRAIEKCGLKHWNGKEGIITVGADGLQSAFESIRFGKLTATVNVGPVDQGREFIMAVFMHEVFGYNVDRIINIPTKIIDKSNVDVAAAYTDWALGTEYP